MLMINDCPEMNKCVAIYSCILGWKRYIYSVFAMNAYLAWTTLRLSSGWGVANS